MKILLFLHSTTGNTRLVARFASNRLRALGHECRIQDIGRHPDAPQDLHSYDLLGFACPTMYWRPTLAMERFVARMPSAEPGPTPAFQLATAGGDPGAQFALLAEQLQYKGFVTLGARFVPMVNNWPAHRAFAERVPMAETVARTLEHAAPGQRASLSLIWPDVGEPELRHRDDIAAWVERLAAQAERRDFSGAPAPAALWKGNKAMYAIGRMMTMDKMQLATNIRIDAVRCDHCGTCVKLCPVGCLTRASEDEVPTLGTGCTGCWTCHQHCPQRAISGMGAPHGAGRYEGPSPTTRDLFR